MKRAEVVLGPLAAAGAALLGLRLLRRAWERLEEALIAADVGVPSTAELVRRLEARGELGDIREALVEEAGALLGEPGRLALDGQPSVILVVGVNGTGKTTTIGKLAHRLREHGRSVVLGAADTFRAAAEEQLEIWADRAGGDFVGGERGGDPAAVAYDAIETATQGGRDVVIVDTAGRLHTQTNLMRSEEHTSELQSRFDLVCRLLLEKKK